MLALEAKCLRCFQATIITYLKKVIVYKYKGGGERGQNKIWNLLWKYIPYSFKLEWFIMKQTEIIQILMSLIREIKI